MRRLLKLLFSQIVIISLLLILQVGLLAYLIVGLSRYFIYVDLLLKLISVIVVILIVNRHSNPVYKLAWVMPILAFPLFGGLFYLFIMGQRHTKRFFKNLSEIEKQTTQDFPQNPDVFHEISTIYPHRAPTVKYINNVAGLCAYRLKEAQYFTVGEEKWKALLCELEKAQKYIFLEYFIIKDGQMWESVLDILKRKAAAGVDVRILYDGMGSMENFPANYPRTLSSYGIKCRVFSPFTPFLSALQNNRDHRKIAVIDGTVAFTGGVNLSDEYINIGYDGGHWKDMSVMIKGSGAFSFAIMFLQMWSVATGEKIRSLDFAPSFEDDGAFSGYVMPYSDTPQDKYQTGEFIYLDIINKAKKYIYITTPYLILDHEMVVALTNAALSGVDVKIICPLSVDHWYARAVSYSYYKELTESGVEIYEYTPGFIHGKTFCSDDELAVVGSINLDYRSLYLHFECAAWFIDSPIVDAVLNDFKTTLKKCRLVTVEDCNKISPLKKMLNAFLRLFAPLM